MHNWYIQFSQKDEDNYFTNRQKKLQIALHFKVLIAWEQNLPEIRQRELFGASPILSDEPHPPYVNEYCLFLLLH